MSSKYPNKIKNFEIELAVDFYHLDKGDTECQYMGVHIDMPHCGMCDEDFPSF